ncbi:hypothetical protein HRR78_006331 [Exophiala dermatitidis]|nr:hypothetical protein HRR75_006235 [Exophiala dermatitidis]KAJ4545609.1 hypothetical protein HRR78_006331 [Exophiala dermatitidis]
MLSDQSWCQDATSDFQAASTPPYSDYTGEQTPRLPYYTPLTAALKSAPDDVGPDLPGQVTPQYYTGNFYPHHTLALTTPPQEINQASLYPCPSNPTSLRMYDTGETSYACSYFTSPPINQPGYDHDHDHDTGACKPAEYASASYPPSSLVWSCHATTVESSSATIQYRTTPHIDPKLEAEPELKPKTEMETAEMQLKPKTETETAEMLQQQQHYPAPPFYTCIYRARNETDSMNMPVLITLPNGPQPVSQAKR